MASGKEKNEISVEAFQNILEAYNNTEFSLAISGGEPLLHPKFWELVKLADERKRIILDRDEKEKVLSILDTTIGNLNKTLCNLCKKQLFEHKPTSQKYYLNKSLFIE